MTPVYFVLYQDLLATSLCLPLEMLQAANDLHRASRREQRLHIVRVSDTLETIHTPGGIDITPEYQINNLPPAEKPPVIFLPGLWRNPRKSLARHHALVKWLKQQIEAGATVCAAGTGSCFLAETGLLNGKPATSHWFYLDTFQTQYPEVLLKHQHLITQAGKLYCAASVNALADLTVHLINHLFDRRTSAHVERHFSHEARRSFEDMRFIDDQPTRHQDEEIIQVQLWLNQNFNKSFQLYDLSKKFDMSKRNFDRRFKAATGKSPLQYLQEIRIANARDLLKNSNLNILEASQRVGYQDTAHFSALFREFTGMTPSAFRKSVRSKLFSL
jgi:transcriptional regulator GlxA family with amidase domain